MIKSTPFVKALGLLLIVSAPLGGAQAALLMRTWVSGTGDDGNACTRMSPCGTWAGALAKTSPGGEIDAIDPGGFGAVTIDRSITLDGQGQLASTLSTGSTAGIFINAKSTDVVRLRNLSVNGIANSGSGGTNGIVFEVGAALFIENCVVQNFANAGIDFAPSVGSNAMPQLFVTGTTVSNNNVGILIAPDNDHSAAVSVVRSASVGNSGGGVRAQASPSGTAGGSSILLGISESTISNNGANGVVTISTPVASVTANLADVSIMQNGQAGVQSNAASGGTSVVTVGASMLAANGVALKFVAPGATLLTYGNNLIHGPNGTGFSGPIAQQ